MAIQELVKNSYDADARKVVIEFVSPLVKGAGAIVITDDGHGMDLKTVLNSWMEPATSFKPKGGSSPGGRKFTGEKGIGRFAAARVAERLEMITVSANTGRRVTATFEWGRFDDAKRYLNSVRCSWAESEPPEGTKPGTTLRLVRLIEDWSEGEDPESGRGNDFETLRQELSRLVSPTWKSRDFRIKLVLPARFATYAGDIEPPKVLDRYMYRLMGKFHRNGKMEATYEEPCREVQEEIESEIRLTRKKGQPAYVPTSGPFTFEFRVWDREPESIKVLAKELKQKPMTIKRDLNSATSVSVYRDKFRVLIPRTDWLRLDMRRVQNPSMRVSNNQLVGWISITLADNPALTDQSNRMAIVDSPAFEDFRDAIKAILSVLEARRAAARAERLEGRLARGIFTKLDLGELRTYLERKYPKDNELREFVEKKAEEFRIGVKEIQTELSRYRRLATLGQLIDIILHDGKTPLSAIASTTTKVKEELPLLDESGFTKRNRPRLDRIENQALVLQALFDRLRKMGGRTRRKMERTTFEAVARDTIALHEREIAADGIEVEVPTTKTEVYADPGQLQIIFQNLLENSLYWVQQKPEGKRKIRLEVSRAGDEYRLVWSDSGPGVPKQFQERIWEPYFSLKPDGVGLGLKIVGETAAEYDGSARLIADGPLEGATFLVTLRRIQEKDHGSATA